jgi:hypothetical protein
MEMKHQDADLREVYRRLSHGHFIRNVEARSGLILRKVVLGKRASVTTLGMPEPPVSAFGRDRD